MKNYRINYKANDDSLEEGNFRHQISIALEERLGYERDYSGANNMLFIQSVYWAPEDYDAIWIDVEKKEVAKQRGSYTRQHFLPSINIHQPFEKSELKVLDVLGLTIMPKHSAATGQDITDWFGEV